MNFIKKHWLLILLAVLFFLAPLAEIIAFQYLYSRDLNVVMDWMGNNKFWIISFTYLIILSFQLLIYAIFNNISISLSLTFILFTLMNVINYYKLQILNEPLYPWDMFLYEQLVDLFPLVAKVVDLKYLFLLLIVIALLVIFCKFMPNYKVKWIPRVILLICSLLLITGFILNDKNPTKQVFAKYGISNALSTPKTNVSINGLILSFVLYLPDVFIDKPDGYSEEAIKKIADSLDFNADSADETAKPNVIVIMSESLFDITRLASVEFNKDPIPTIRHNMSGALLSPTFGGGTSSVEFEALTGLSNVFLPSGSSAYQQYIKKDIPSLASVFENKGYYPFALHTYHGWYWNRETVYDYLGFSDFISGEDLTDAPIKGQYIGDETITNEIIDKIEEKEEPVFVYAVTMQNHSPYVANLYEENSITVENNISKSNLDMIESYATGISDSDYELSRMIKYFNNSEEPTLIVMFGDHLPSLGTEMAVYNETGFLNSENSYLENQSLIRQTPLVVWKNFGDQVKVPDLLSPAFLSPIIFENAGLEMPKYYEFLKKFSTQLPGYISTVKVDSNGDLYNKTPEESRELEEMYEMLQYDLLFGKQYSKEYLFD
ncbi:LTA synthase family protein [Lysinibacillus sp. SGAir0095]|uniref:LTA synthase family protein n=1 Tax=Lysinibacillus sp. SGAir0095 TaxID=2070463 RepID=UPI0010CD69D2|nr:alkaline phosphatase family protein [Lysinibacillus sp. SGAir0095]QCR33995.1 LTA synthase family protein [Lysinibacillus sp. SGAir0095]